MFSIFMSITSRVLMMIYRLPPVPCSHGIRRRQTYYSQKEQNFAPHSGPLPLLELTKVYQDILIKVSQTHDKLNIKTYLEDSQLGHKTYSPENV